MRFMLLAPLAALVGFPAAAPAAVPAGDGAVDPPNVLLILTDDLGYNDIGLNGNPLVRTPHIDGIARQGVRFVTGYSSHSVCAPSRAGLMTGRYQQRFGFEYVRTPDAFVHTFDGTYPTDDVVELRDVEQVPEAEAGLPLTEVSLARLLKENGYATGMFGKWHLGSARRFWPEAHGFDEFTGFPGGAARYSAPDDASSVEARLTWSGIDNYLWANLPFRMVDNGRPVEPEGYVTEVLARRTADFIRRHHEQPFFAYLAFNAPHNPLDAPKRIYDRLSHISDHKTRVYYAMVEAVDEGVGLVLDTLDELGLAENTIVIFSSDNGGAWYTRIPVHNLPYRGWKATFFEGGVNVPFMIRWPRTIPPGQVVPGPASQLDVVPTVAAATGAALPDDRVIDGRNLLPMLESADPASYRELEQRTLFWRQGNYAVLRQGRWKLQVTSDPDAVWLFDLERDPTEQVNVASRLPDRVAELRRALRELSGDMAEPAWQPPYRMRMRVGPHVDEGDRAQTDLIWNG